MALSTKTLGKAYNLPYKSIYNFSRRGERKTREGNIYTAKKSICGEFWGLFYKAPDYIIQQEVSKLTWEREDI